jgi:hypothetical protein
MATGATEFIDNTTADAFIPEVWSKKAIVAREAELVFADLFDRSYEGEMSYGDTLHVPSVTNLSAQTKSVNTAIVYETQTEANTDITVTTWEYSAFAIETKTKKQAMQDLVRRYAPKQGYALGLSMDAVGAGLVDDFGTNIVGTLGTPTSYSDWLLAEQYLNDANVPMDGRFIVISPAEKKNLMEMDQFVNRDYEKLQSADTPRKDLRRIGTWLTYPVYMSTHVEGSNAAGHDNVMAHRDAAALVVQIDMPSYHFFDIDYFADKYAVECLYGWKEMRDDHGVWVRGA